MKIIVTKNYSRDREERSFVRVDNISNWETIDPYYCLTTENNGEDIGEGKNKPLPVAIRQGCGASIRFLRRWLSGRSAIENQKYAEWHMKNQVLTGENNTRFVEIISRDMRGRKKNG